LGFVEFDVAGRMFVDGAVRRHLNNELVLRAFEEALKAAANPEEHRSAIREAFRRFGFTHAELNMFLASTGAHHAGAVCGSLAQESLCQ